MATLLRIKDFRVFVYSHDHEYPPHVHVQTVNGLSKWELKTWQCVERTKGCKANELRKIRQMLMQNEHRLLEKWHEHWQRARGGEGR